MSKSTVSPAGGRRFWVTVLCFAIANTAAWAGYIQWQRAHRHHLLEVTQFTPGDGATVSGRPTLTWSFNLDCAPPAPNSPPPGQITPNIPGKWQWTDPRTLTFAPDAEFPRATPLTITLSLDSNRTPDGFRLPKPYVASLATPSLAVTSVDQAAFDDGDRVIIEFTFNDKVIPADLRKHLSLHGSNGHEITFQPHGDLPARVVRVITDPVSALVENNPAPAIDVHISQGLCGAAGPLGLPDDYVRRVPVAADLMATETAAYFPSNSDPYVQILFNNPVDARDVQQVLSIEPSVQVTLSSGWRGIEVHGPFLPGARYALKISKPPTGIAGKRVPRPTTLSVLIPDRDPGLWFENEFGYLGAQGNRTVLAHGVNMTDLRATVTRIYDNNIVAWRNAGRRGYWRDTDSFSRPLVVRDIHLPARKNDRQDLRLSLDDLLPEGEARDGVYQISLTHVGPNEPLPNWAQDDDDNENHGYYSYRTSASMMVTLSDIALSAKQGRDGIVVWATSLRTAKPLPGVRLRLYSDKNQLLGEAVTESTGLATIVPLPGGPGEKPVVLLADRPESTEARDGGKETDHDSSQARGAAAHLEPIFTGGHGLTWLDLRGSEVNFGDADTGGRPYLRHGYEAFVYTDRGVYRPGETVHLRAILRGPKNTVAPRFPIRWQIRRPDLHDWKAQMAEIDADGATSFDLALPTDLPSGRWTAHVGLPGEPGASSRFFGSIAFDVEDFMPQRMKVNVEIGADAHNAASDRIAVNDDPIVAHVQADYLFGRPVAERPASLVVRVDPIPFQPPAYREWTFGDAANTADALGHGNPLGRRAELPSIDLDANGHAKWDVDINALINKGDIPEDSAAPRTKGHSHGSNHTHRPAPDVAGKSTDYAGPWRLTITGSVTETGGRAITATRAVDLDRVPRYIGARPRETTQRPGITATFDVQCVTPAGAPASGDADLQVTLYRETWNNSYVFEKFQYHFQSTRILEPLFHDPQALHVGGGKGQFTLVPPTAGAYVALIRDPKTQVVTTLGFYAGYGAWEDSISRQNPERLDLVIQPTADTSVIDAAIDAIDNRDLAALFALADRPAPGADGKLRVGRPAQVIVRSPFAGELLLSIETDGVITTHVVEMPTNHIAVPIDITEACRPNAYVTATVLRPVDPNTAWTIHRAIGVARMVVDNSDRKLTVELATPKEIRPEASLAVPLRVIDSSGNPVPNAAVTVAAVDEGICRLTDFQTPDPFDFFTTQRALAVETADLFGQLMPEIAKTAGQSTTGGDEGSAFNLRRGSPIGARRITPVALVSAVLHTDAQGLARADFSTPQFTGQLRVMAVASAPAGFGSVDAPVLVRAPLMVQSSWPRFAAPGDRFTVPLLVFNNSTAAAQVSLHIELTDAGPLRFAANNGIKFSLRPMTIPAGGQAQTAFDIIAQDRIGVAHARLISTMNGETSEEAIELPVRPASPAVTAGAYLNANPATPALVEVPSGFVDGTSKFELRISASPQLQLPEGLDYLDRYPYGCVEQTTSTLFPLVYLSDIGGEIAPGLFEKSHVADKVQVGMLRLLSMQTENGGLSMWPGERENWPWGSVYAAHFLVEAQAAGFDVPQGLRDPLLGYLRELLNQPEENDAIIELHAYASYVLALAGKPPRPVMARLSEVLKNDDAGSARFHLAAAWLAAGRRDLATGLIPAAIPAPRADRDLGGNIGSAVRDRAILVSTLLAVDPQDPRIPTLAQQLAESGRARQWRSTQDTAFAVLAIGRYLRHAKDQTPYQTAQILLNGNPIASSEGDKPLVWNATSVTGAKAPVAAYIPAPGTKIEVRVTGAAGAMGHVAWLETGVRTTPPPNADSGLTIRRRYLDEHGTPLESMRVRSGDLVQVELTLRSDDPLEHVVIEDLLPAGLEIENPRLAGNAAAITVHPHHKAHWRNVDSNDDSPAFDVVRSDMRDDRLILVGNLTRAGTGTYLYTARAVTPGKYVLPPVKAECMYDSGINSLWGAGTFEVLPVEAKVVGAAQ